MTLESYFWRYSRIILELVNPSLCQLKSVCVANYINALVSSILTQTIVVACENNS